MTPDRRTSARSGNVLHMPTDDAPADRLPALLDAWRAEVNEAPIPDLVDVDTAAAVVAQARTPFRAWPPLPGEMPGRNPGQWATCHPTRLAVEPARSPFDTSGTRLCEACAGS